MQQACGHLVLEAGCGRVQQAPGGFQHQFLEPALGCGLDLVGDFRTVDRLSQANVEQIGVQQLAKLEVWISAGQVFGNHQGLLPFAFTEMMVNLTDQLLGAVRQEERRRFLCLHHEAPFHGRLDFCLLLHGPP